MNNKAGIRGILRIYVKLLRIIASIILGCPGMSYGSAVMQNENKFILAQSRQLISSRPSETPIDVNHQFSDPDINSHNYDEFPVIDNDSNQLEEFFRTPMSFGTENLTLVTTQVGATAHIPCIVHYIGEGVVSWIRRKDYHLLTVALTTYSSDERFSATHLKNSEDWSLQIKFVQPRDAGTYECQVSTHPPTSIFLHLNVIEARAEIIGPPVRYLTPDSTLRLICRIIQSTETSAFLFWYHDDRMINYDIDRGINISTEADFHYSELAIPHTTKKHSGNYSCVPSNAQPASVLVHIFKGDNPAAMHHDHLNGAKGFHETSLSFIWMQIIVTLYLSKLINYIYSS